MTVTEPHGDSNAKQGPFHLTLSRDGHKEMILVSFKEFHLAEISTPYYSCDVHSSPCCVSGLDETEVKQGIGKRCDEEFGTGYWIYRRYQRASPLRANDTPCADWQDDRLLQEQLDDSIPTVLTLQRTIEAVEDEASGSPAKRRCTNNNSVASKNSRGSKSNNQDGEKPNEGNVVGPTERVENATRAFMAKFRTGLQRLKRKPKSIGSTTIGSRLAEHVEHSTNDDGTEIEAILEDSKSTQKSNLWLIDFHYRFVSYRRRHLNPRYSETGDCIKEWQVKQKEFFCEFLSLIVNNLEPKWGVCASLVYNVLEETGFKGSSLYKLGMDLRQRAVDLILEQLLSIENIVVQKCTHVLNPVFFISSVMSTPPSTAFGNIKMGNFSKYNIEEHITANRKNLKELGLDCGRISLCTLLEIELGRELQPSTSDDDCFTIHFGEPDDRYLEGAQFRPSSVTTTSDPTSPVAISEQGGHSVSHSLASPLFSPLGLGTGIPNELSYHSPDDNDDAEDRAEPFDGRVEIGNGSPYLEPALSRHATNIDNPNNTSLQGHAIIEGLQQQRVLPPLSDLLRVAEKQSQPPPLLLPGLRIDEVLESRMLGSLTDNSTAACPPESVGIVPLVPVSSSEAAHLSVNMCTPSSSQALLDNGNLMEDANENHDNTQGVTQDDTGDSDQVQIWEMFEEVGFDVDVFNDIEYWNPA